MGLMFLISVMHLSTEKALCNAMYLKPECKGQLLDESCGMYSLLKSAKCIVSEEIF
jgi:hypothetical protein